MLKTLVLDGFEWRVMYSKGGIYALTRKEPFTNKNIGIIYNENTGTREVWFDKNI